MEGGMPADFKPADHGLTKLKVAARGGVVFATRPGGGVSRDLFGPNVLRLL